MSDRPSGIMPAIVAIDCSVEAQRIIDGQGRIPITTVADWVVQLVDSHEQIREESKAAILAFQQGRMWTYWRCPQSGGYHDHPLDLISSTGNMRLSLYDWREAVDPKGLNQTLPPYGSTAVCLECGWQGPAHEAVEWREMTCP